MASLWAFRFLLWYIVILLVQPQNRFPFMWHWQIADISMMLCLGLHAFSVVLEDRPLLRFGVASKMAVVLFVWALLSNTLGPLQTIRGWNKEIDYMAKNLLILMLVETMADTPKRVWAVQMSMVIASLWWIKAGIRLSSAGVSFGVGARIMGPAVSLIDNPNGFAYMMCVFIPLYFYNYMRATTKVAQYVFVALNLAAVFIVFQTGSRTGFLILLALAVLMSRNVLKYFKWRSIVLVCGVLLVVAFVSPSNLDRMLGTFQSIRTGLSGEKEYDELTQDEESAVDRRMKNRDTWTVIKNYPVFGAGMNPDNDLLDPWPKAKGVVHNEILMAGIRMGFVGMGLYIMFLSVLFFSGQKVQRTMRDAGWEDLSMYGWSLKLVAVIFAVGGLFSPGAFNIIMLICLALVSSLVTYINKQSVGNVFSPI